MTNTNKTILCFFTFTVVMLLFMLHQLDFGKPFYQAAIKGSKKEIKAAKVPKKDRIDLAVEQEVSLTKDPATGTVPKERLLPAFLYAESLRAAASLNKSAGAILGVNWVERGPDNCGGRTRAIMVDPNDVTRKTIWSAGVGGGLWKTSDITTDPLDWTPINDFFANIAITALCYDPSNTQIMYFGSGEGFFNADAIRGNGIWKSIDGGSSWTQLASTTGVNYNYIQKIAVSSSGEVYAGTRNGLFKSSNGGTSWTKVLGAGTGALTDRISDIEIASDGTIYAGAGLFTTDGIYKSTTGNAGTWTKLNIAGSGFPIAGIQRIEIACAPSNAAVLYVIPAKGTSTDSIYKSTNAGASFTAYRLPVDADGGIGADITRGQAWYDLSLCVDPNNVNVLFVGGIDIFKTSNGCVSWQQVSHWYGGFGYQNVHADQHTVVFEQGNSSVAYFGNDGGIYRTSNATNAIPTIVSKHDNYNITQFYACAMNPTAYSNQFLAGSQDNGSHQYAYPGMNSTIEVTGGDGCFCHIDQNQPQYQFTSYVYNNYYRSSNGGCSFSGITSNNNGSFVNPTDYDDQNNNLYASNGNGNYYVILNAHISNAFTNVNVAAFNGGYVTHISCSPNTSHRVFFGTNNGRVVRADNANTVSPAATNITGVGMPATPVSCIAVENGNDNHLLVTYSSYGVNSIWETVNGGTSWTSVEGNIPDMPVRWALFNPLNNTQAMVATEIGVWSTDMLSGGATSWAPSNTGLANTRVDMLQIRTSDNLVTAATHGRGLFTSDVFTSPHAELTADKTVTYRNSPVKFFDGSFKATSWLWNFGDASTSTSQNPVHSYAAPGLYTVTLTINGSIPVIKANLIQVLPNRGTPYTPAAGGNFDVNALDFGAPVSASSGCGTVTNFERGSSVIGGKSGTRSGSFAWVTSLTSNYNDNSTAYLYSPNFNFAVTGTYTIKIYRKNQFELGYDGFRMEYSLNKGTSWTALGSVAANWYDYANSAFASSFPLNEPYFNSTRSTFTLCQWDVSFLGGNSNVAFRIVFKSDPGVTAPGVALDDFEVIAPVNAPLPVHLLVFTGEPKVDHNLLSWETQSETNNKGFEILRSADGKSFEEIGFVKASGNSSAANEYSYADMDLNQPLYYYMLKQVDLNGLSELSNIIAIRRSGTTAAAGALYPNPATDEIYLPLGEGPAGPLHIKIFTPAGQLVYEKKIIPAQNLLKIPLFGTGLAPGAYILKVETGNTILARKFFRQ